MTFGANMVHVHGPRTLLLQSHGGLYILIAIQSLFTDFKIFIHCISYMYAMYFDPVHSLSPSLIPPIPAEPTTSQQVLVLFS